MDETNSIRKTIFRNELNYIFDKNNLSRYHRDKIVSSIFEDPLESSKQYILKEELMNRDGLDKKLREILHDGNIVGAIKTLFIVQEDLELPNEIKKLFLQNEKIGILVGAGVSKLLNFPLWKELGDSAIEYLYKKNKINYFEYQRIINEVMDPKQKLTIFHNLVPKCSSEAKEFYDQTFSKPKPNGKNPYEILVKFDVIKLTSNIDKEFYKALNLQQNTVFSERIDEMRDVQKIRKAKIVSNEFNSENLDDETIYHIHGIIDEIEQMILTTKDYIEAYFEDKNGLRTFLANIFKEYTIIFVGYGLEEFPILEHIVTGHKEHYVLIGTYLNEINLFKLKQKYFETLKIKPLPYYLDFDGYKRVYIVLSSWLEQIKEARYRDYYQKIKMIDEVID